ncbi:uncharacterized protein EAF01_002374 [Botrytis porri]|uniref:uncharacterized protein n=1 Tax=Botrytis porri TaxID=87229 RepID=UPI00190161E3|nr:uncharacterized protein EAF01_002374 [Botrytis porri]KAF7910865.1 hypothetical protein EAF01_002374 [Botrytis porri]
MSPTFALPSTSASALQIPVIVIDTCIVGADFDSYSYSSFTPSRSSPSQFFSSSSPLSPQCSSVSKFLRIPRCVRMGSPSTRHLRGNRWIEMEGVGVRQWGLGMSRTPRNSPVSAGAWGGGLGGLDFGKGGWGVGWNSLAFSEGEGGGEGIGRGKGELGMKMKMSPVAPPNTPCSPLDLGLGLRRLERGSMDEDGEGEGEECEVLILSESESESENENENENETGDSIDIFRDTTGYSTSGRGFGHLPQIVVGCEEGG